MLRQYSVKNYTNAKVVEPFSEQAMIDMGKPLPVMGRRVGLRSAVLRAGHPDEQ